MVKFASERAWEGLLLLAFAFACEGLPLSSFAFVCEGLHPSLICFALSGLAKRYCYLTYDVLSTL
jgi:hypothetical protein